MQKSINLLCAIVLGCVPLFAVAHAKEVPDTPSLSFSELYVEAETAYAKGYYSNATKLYRTILLSPDLPQKSREKVLVGLIEACTAGNYLKEARKEACSFLRNYPNSEHYRRVEALEARLTTSKYSWLSWYSMKRIWLGILTMPIILSSMYIVNGIVES